MGRIPWFQVRELAHGTRGYPATTTCLKGKPRCEHAYTRVHCTKKMRVRDRGHPLTCLSAGATFPNNTPSMRFTTLALITAIALLPSAMQATAQTAAANVDPLKAAVE